jgi:transcription antitermination factor NusA-like protein
LAPRYSSEGGASHVALSATPGACAARYPDPIHSEPQFLPTFDCQTFEAAGRYPYGARSEAAAFVGDLLLQEVPALAEGKLDLVALARRPGVLSKVAIRSRLDWSVHIAPGIGADHIARVRDRLDGERIDVVAWQRSADAYIADALGLGQVPRVVLLPGIRHARVLLGEIDVRGIAGWRGLNTVLASALTGWRIRLEPVAVTAAWRRLRAAMLSRRPVPASVVGHTERGTRVELLGLYAVLPGPPSERIGQDLDVRVTRMDADEGRIFVSDRPGPTSQLTLPL